MRIQIDIDLENDAFQPDPASEVGRLLREIARDLESGRLRMVDSMTKRLHDVNGNNVGGLEITED